MITSAGEHKPIDSNSVIPIGTGIAVVFRHITGKIV